MEQQQQQQNKTYLVWALRILVAALFLFSAYAKMYKVWAFEKQLVDLGIASWCSSHYWARFLIGLEIATGLALLQNNYIKTIVIPGTILLLVMFNIHLSIEMYKHGAMNGNCGCFGELIKMTPLEAFLKNLATMAILVYLFFKVKNREQGQNRIIYPLAMFFAALAFMFILYPFAPCGAKAPVIYNPPTPTSDSTVKPFDTTLVNTVDGIQTELAGTNSKDTGVTKNNTSPKPTIDPKKATQTGKEIKTPVVNTPPPVTHSRFGQFTQFGKVTANLDQGKKIVCLFAPGCDHCRNTAKQLGEIAAANPNFPELYILFMDEEAFKIPEFFQETKTNFPYTILDIPTFWEVMGPDASTPGVYYLENGKLIKFYQGIEKQEFNVAEFKKVIGAN